ncbi:MAG: aminoacyl-tRNA hydrolase [Lachnospiraceae bacterium]|nr:aminoacyl-tRNA hydrolase [Lachnospiraceae bacterium]
MYLIVGLGNPTEKYEKTRHNIGFDVIDALAAKYDIDVDRKRAKAICGSGMIGGSRVLLAKPQTYMNLSGDSVSRLIRFYKLDPEKDLIVVFDDISLAPGNIRIRKKGSAGGHNGMKDIIAKVGTDQFSRVKVGAGEKPPGGDLIRHVLSRFSAAERKLVDEAIEDAAGAIALMAGGDTDEAMNRYNRKKHPADGEEQEES